MPAGLKLLLRGCRTVAQIQGKALLCCFFFPNPANFGKNRHPPKVVGTFLCAPRRILIFFCVTNLTFKSILTLWYFTCFAKDKTSWDCTDSVSIPVCRLTFLVKSVNGCYSQCYSYVSQSVCSEDFIGLSGRGTQKLESGNDNACHFG